MHPKPTTNQRPYVAVRAIITNPQNQVLILKRDKTDFGQGAWCLPGGKVDYGQTVVEALAAELREELSVRLLSAEFAWYQNSLPPVSGDPHYINFYFHCRIEGKIRLNEESSAFAWIGPEDIPNYPIVFRNDEAILRFFSDFHPQNSCTSKEGGQQ